ncbi:SpoIIE family protein phosphatase [Thermomonospora umbrina]|uniref:protein-serine/threonine phosphatase n=1 Tax=Thermomonospora umbrina TaxID=111806 RepID=A0A3D9SMN0_9ACTN|nr:SpoIIE family protein phosphatase [Thermomonospora umbrina]REE95670.1 serine phosphatase RsbU (regulator of sigma subunit) [Thermomonospora umbrina]
MGDARGTGGEGGAAALDPLLIRTLQEVGAAATTVYLLRPGEEVLWLAVASRHLAEVLQPWGRVALTTPTPGTDAVVGNELIWVNGQEELARRYPRVALTLPYRFALAAAPITAGERRWGALVVLWSSHPPRLTRRERARIGEACTHIAELLQRAEESGRPIVPGAHPHQLPEPEARSAGPAEAIAAVDFAERLPQGAFALDVVGRMMFVNGTAAELLGRPRAELLGRMPWEALPWLDDPIYEDRYRAAVFSQQPVTFTARRPPDRLLEFELYPDSRGMSVCVTPTTSGGGEPIPDDGAAGGPSRVGAIYQLMHLAVTLAEAASVRDVFDLIAEQIGPAFGAQGLVLLLTEGSRLRIVGQRGYDPGALDVLDVTSPQAPTTPSQYVLVNGVPAFFSSPEPLERIYPGITRITGKSAWAYLPLKVSGRPVGCCILSYTEPHFFPEEERTLLTSLAGLLAQALDRARHFDAKQELAHSLQESLLPTVLPTVDGLEVAARYVPATTGLDIGGDFYDLIPLDATTSAAVIGDVQGHNVTAAALMGQVRTAVHAFAAAGAPPGRVLAHTNRLLTDLGRDLFTSCLYVHLDLKTRTACLASAGHPAPLLRRARGRVDTLEIEPGLLLGIEPDVEYPTVEVSLPPDAVLTLYTDGLVETSDTDLDDSIAHLAGALAEARYDSIEELADILLGDRRRAGPLGDDIALLLLNVR